MAKRNMIARSAKTNRSNSLGVNEPFVRQHIHNTPIESNLVRTLKRSGIVARVSGHLYDHDSGSRHRPCSKCGSVGTVAQEPLFIEPVGLDHQGIARARFIAQRLHQTSFPLISVSVRPVDYVGLSQFDLFELGIQIPDDMEVRASFGRSEDLRGLVDCSRASTLIGNEASSGSSAPGTCFHAPSIPLVEDGRGRTVRVEP